MIVFFEKIKYNVNTNTFFDKSIIYSAVELNDAERVFVESTILGPFFPWFWQDKQTFGDEEQIPLHIKSHLQSHNGQFLSHTLLFRTEDESIKYNARPAHQVSPHFEFFLELFHRFMTANNLKYKNIFRANLNLTWHNSEFHTTPHKDHDWPHSNFVMYLTTCEQGQTIIWPNDFSASYMIPCVQYHAVTFEQLWHAQRYPAAGDKRLVFVLTYI